MLTAIATNLVLSLLQVLLGGVIAFLCFLLVRARLLAIHIVGILVTAFLIFRYAHGTWLSLRFVLEGEWTQSVTGVINIVLAVATSACAVVGNRHRRTAGVDDSRSSRPTLLGLSLTLGLVLRTIAWVGGLALHLWTVWFWYGQKGIIAAVIALVLPVLAEVFTFIGAWRALGFSNPYGIACLAYVGVLLVGSLLLAAGAGKTLSVDPGQSVGD